MSLASSNRGSARVIGLAIASVIGAAAIGVIAWSFSRHRQAALPPANADDSQSAPDIKSGSGAMAGSMPADFGKGKRLRFEYADRNDPSRLAGLITAETFEQNESRRYTMHNPVAWSYQRDGRVARVSSQRGKAYLPATEKGSRPESGVLDGDVVFKFFAAPPAGREIDAEHDTPILTGKTEVIQYDGLLGEIKVPAPNQLDVTSEQVDFSGVGVTVLFNEPEERLESLHIEKAAPAGLVYRPSGTRVPSKPGEPIVNDPATAPAPPSDGTAAPVAPPSSASPVAVQHEPVVTFYHIVVDDNVQVVQGGRKINADHLAIWLRLVDNKLADGALMGGPTSVASTSDGEPASSSGGVSIAPNEISLNPPATQQPGITDSSAKPGTTSENDAPIHITWTGPLDIRPMQSRPPQLASNEVALLFSSDKAGRVIASDEASKTRAEGQSLSFAATTREIVLSGDGPRGATLTLKGVGEAVAEKFEMNLATGLARVPGPGQLVASSTEAGIGAVSDFSDATADKPADKPSKKSATRGPRVLSWGTSAEFQFAVENGSPTSRLAEARLSGNVQGLEDAGSLSGDSMTAFFEPDPAKPDRTLLSRLAIKGRALAMDNAGGALSAESIETLFGPKADGSGVEPVHVTATGGALAARGDSTIKANVIRASLVHNEGADLAVSDASAHTSVVFSGKDGIEASGDELFVTPQSQVVDLVGTRVQIGRGLTSITGTNIHLEGLSQRLTVVGAGTFEHRAGTEPEAAHAFASWTRQMIFDDKAGEVDCLGVVRVVWEPDPLAVDTLGGERVLVSLTPSSDARSFTEFTSSTDPAKPVDPAAAAEDHKPVEVRQGSSTARPTAPENAAPPTPPPAPLPTSRKILRARIEGGEAADLTTTIAKVESRRFAPAETTVAAPAAAPAPADAPSRTLQQLSYLEGIEIIADNERGTLTSPGAGKLLLVDQRARLASPSPDLAGSPDTLLSGASSRGNALFAWQGSMDMSRADSTIRMTNAVRMDHVRSDDGMRTALECDEMVAKVEGVAPPSTLPETPRAKPSEQPADAAKPDAALPDISRGGRLASALATGRVWLKTGTREMRADQVRYDADEQTADSLSNEGSNVTVFDQGSATPVSARAVLWNMKTGRLEIKKPGTIVAPR